MHVINKQRKLYIHVMVVDDHPLMREGIVSQLRRGHGVKVVGEAANGAELLSNLESNSVDVVLLDLQMPEINGAQALMQLQKRFPHLKILVLSMFNEKRMMREMIRMGANGSWACWERSGAPERGRRRWHSASLFCE